MEVLRWLIIKSLYLLKLTKVYLFLFLSTLCLSQSSFFEFNEGDIIFQDLDSSPLCEGIEMVTNGYQNMNFSHVGIVTFINDNAFVIEAYSVVDTTKINEFLLRSQDNEKPKIVVGRLKKKYQKLIPGAINFGKKLIGKEYDYEFSIKNDKYYCSELIYEIFFRANNNKPLFNLQPMTYKVNEQTLAVWIDYFDKINITIPEGEDGINPGSLSLSNKINIIYNYLD